MIGKKGPAQGVAQDFDLVLFGGRGDLAEKKLLPGVFDHMRFGTGGHLTRLIGVDRWDLDPGKWLEWVESVMKRSGRPAGSGSPDWAAFAGRLDYVGGDLAKDNRVYDRIMERLAGGAQRRLFWLAVPPRIVETVLAGAWKAGLFSLQTETEVIVEKPFGENLEALQRIADWKAA